MSKFSNLLKLLTLLKANDRMKRKDLAEALGVSERMIRKYIDDLVEANINIESISGPSGGYQIKGYDYLLNIDVEKEEIESLDIVINEMKSECREKIYIDNLEALSTKLKSVCKNEDFECTSYINESIPNYLDENVNIELDIQAASITRKKIIVSYQSISSGTTVRTLRPYAIVTRNNMKYLIAYCEQRNDIRTFKLTRIKSIEVLNDKFEIDNGFDLKEYMKNKIGIFTDEDINLKLLIRKPFSYSVSERIYAENQTIKWNKDDESILFEAYMNGKKDIIRWILSMGKSVTIIEPVELKDEIKNILKDMIENI